jgi:hypothetical protein
MSFAHLQQLNFHHYIQCLCFCQHCQTKLLCKYFRHSVGGLCVVSGYCMWSFYVQLHLFVLFVNLFVVLLRHSRVISYSLKLEQMCMCAIPEYCCIPAVTVVLSCRVACLLLVTEHFCLCLYLLQH